MIEVDLSNRQTLLDIDAESLTGAVRAVLEGEGLRSASISLAVVDDPEMHQLNRQFLEHDYPTDVLSFIYTPQPLDGEVVVSTRTALRSAEQLNVPPSDELLLYTIHGTLHLVGLDDQSEEDRATMRAREQHYLGLLATTDRHAPAMTNQNAESKSAEGKET